MDVKNKSIASLVCGIIAIVSIFTGYFALLGLVLGIIGIVLGVNVKKQMETMGDISNDPNLKDARGLANAGLICSIIGTVIAGIGFLCVACLIGTIGAAACTMPGAF